MVNGGDRWTEGWTYKKMDWRTDRRTDVSKFNLCSTGHRPFGAAALLSLYLFTGSLPAGLWVPLTMCDPWMTCSFSFSFTLFSSLIFSSRFYDFFPTAISRPYWYCMNCMFFQLPLLPYLCLTLCHARFWSVFRVLVLVSSLLSRLADCLSV